LCIYVGNVPVGANASPAWVEDQTNKKGHHPHFESFLPHSNKCRSTESIATPCICHCIILEFWPLLSFQPYLSQPATFFITASQSDALTASFLATIWPIFSPFLTIWIELFQFYFKTFCDGQIESSTDCVNISISLWNFL